MATASEIRRRVREQEKRRIEARADAAIAVGEAAARLDAAEAAIVAAMEDLEAAVAAALADHGFGMEELAETTDLQLRRVRWPRSITPLRDALKARKSDAEVDEDDDSDDESGAESMVKPLGEGAVVNHAAPQPQH